MGAPFLPFLCPPDLTCDDANGAGGPHAPASSQAWNTPPLPAPLHDAENRDVTPVVVGSTAGVPAVPSTRWRPREGVASAASPPGHPGVEYQYAATCPGAGMGGGGATPTTIGAQERVRNVPPRAGTHPPFVNGVVTHAVPPMHVGDKHTMTVPPPPAQFTRYDALPLSVGRGAHTPATTTPSSRAVELPMAHPVDRVASTVAAWDWDDARRRRRRGRRRGPRRVGRGAEWLRAVPMLGGRTCSYANETPRVRGQPAGVWT